MSCQPINFESIDEARFASFISKLTSMSGASIHVLDETDGIETGQVQIEALPIGRFLFSYTWNKPQQNLLIACISKPFFFPCSEVNHLVNEHINN